jgi:FtsP/CotA-like multicopper oxidase with cupredoxin domain
MFERGREARQVRGGALLNLGALLTLGAAAIHFAVAPEHFQEYAPFGVFFVIAGSAQVLLAGALLSAPSRRLLAVAAFGTLGVVGLYLVSRTVGLPIGPRPGKPEAVGIPDVVCTFMEVLSVLLFGVLAARRHRLRARRPVRLALATLPGVVLVSALAAAGVGAAAGGMPLAFNASPMVPGRPSTTVDLLTDPPGPQPVKSFTLTTEVRRINGQEAWTYDGSVPGPELRVTQGDRVRVTLVNHLPAATTIHWHGVLVPNAEDGVAGITQQAVAPGNEYTYEFVVTDTGTYWYHSHQDTGNQLVRGLFGPLVVEPAPGRVPEDRDYTLMLHGAPGSGAVAVNGSTGDLRLAAQAGQTVRLRLINAVPANMDGGPEAPVLLGAPYRVVSLDGHELNDPQPLGPRRLPLGMGQRADLVFTMPRGGSVKLVDTEVHGAASAGERFFPQPPPLRVSVTVGDGPGPAAGNLGRLPMFDPTRYGVPTADPVASARPDATYPLLLDEQPGFHDGTVQLVHTINGRSSPDVPPITVREGQVVRLHIVNDTGEYHPMHLHGHVFSVLAEDGRRVQGSPVHLDSVMVGPHQTWDVAFLADNPGIWMLHCHVLLHATMGMSMAINYAGITTPYTIGMSSGNTPE